MKSQNITVLLTCLLIGCSSSTNPQAAQYNATLSILYSEEKSFEQARIKAYHALELDPKSAQANFAIAFYAHQTQQSELAQKYYQFALKQDPQSGEINQYYAQFLCEQKNYTTALEYFEKATNDTHYPKISEIYSKAGECALLIPNKPLADILFTKAHQLDPKHF